MTPDEKAQAVVNGLKRGFGANFFEFKFDAPDDDFKLKVRNPAPVEHYIRQMSVRDSGTGEDIEAVKDDPGKEELLMVGYFSIHSKGRDADGMARLQIGSDYPMAEVATCGKTGSQITLELIDMFNNLYEKLGLTACELPGVPGSAIDKVPCPLGIRAGTTDTGLVTDRDLLQRDLLD